MSGDHVPAIVLRLVTVEDAAAVREVIVSAFGTAEGPGVADMVDAIRAGAYARPEFEWVATRGKRLVGHVALSGATLVTASGERVVLMLSPLSVTPDEQGYGTGSALVRHVVSLAEAAGEPLIVLEGDPSYYGRLGFEASAPRGILMDLPEWAPPEAAQVRLLTSYGDGLGLRGRIVFPPYVPLE